MDLDLLPADPFTFADALAHGATRQQLRTAVRRGHLVSPARGWYARAALHVEAGEHWETTRADHLQRLRAALHTHPGAAASHDSAAALHGLPIVLSPRGEVQVVHVETYPTSRRLPGVVLHHADSVPTPTVTVDGLRTTPVARTVADVLRTRRPPHGLALLDQSIRQGRVTLDEVKGELDAQRRWVGKVRAKEVLDLVDPVRESWAESYSFGMLAGLGMPRAIPQVDILDERFGFVGRVDGLLDRHGVFFEVDGEEKYFIGAPGEQPEETARRRIQAEQQRHQALERLGLVGARWTPALAMESPEEVCGRVNRAIARANGQTFTGWVRWEGRLSRLPLIPP